MLKTIKLLLFVALLAGLLIFGGQYFVGYFAKDQIERVASQALGAKVAVGQVRLSLFEGYGEIAGLSIASPEGFRAEEAFGVESVSFDLDPASLLGSPIRIETFAVQNARAVYEVNEKGKGNLNVLLENLSASSGGQSESSTPETPETEAPQTPDDAESASSKKIAVGSVRVANTELVLDLESLGSKRYEETLPEFSAEQVGGEVGLPPEALGREIARVMLRNILAQAEEKYKDKVKTQLKDKVLKGIGTKLQGLLEKL